MGKEFAQGDIIKVKCRPLGNFSAPKQSCSLGVAGITHHLPSADKEIEAQKNSTHDSEPGLGPRAPNVRSREKLMTLVLAVISWTRHQNIGMKSKNKQV